MQFSEFKSFVELNLESEMPAFVELDEASELDSLRKFLTQHNIRYQDQSQHQLNEFKEIANCLNLDLNNLISFKYIYLSWGEKTLIKSVDEQTYYKLITWRNNDKINFEEQAIVKSKTVGIVGCSVGSFAVKVLAKLGFVNLRIAEIKNMKPSNSPRMFCDSIRNYGEHKATPLAQSIYELNPYTNLKVYEDGITEHNIDQFIIGDKKVDILIDAADDGITKLRLRHYCQKHRIPLISGYDEKGALVIDRFDFYQSNIDFLSKLEELKLIKEESPADYINKLLEFIPGGRENLTSRQLTTLEGIANKTRGGFSQLAWEASLFASYISKATLEIALGSEIEGSNLLDLDVEIVENMSNKLKEEAS